MKSYKSISITLVCVILGIIMAWQFKSVNFNQEMAMYENKRLDVLKDELINEKRNNENLSKRNSELEKRNLEYEDAQGNIDKQKENLQRELERVRTIAGLTDVRGKGIIITIENPNPDIQNLQDDDILQVLNELRASDTQAISVNDERIVTMSEVRVAGRYVMVNGRQTLQPFVIKAIAEPDKVEHALTMIGGIVEDLERWQLTVKIEKSDNITIPKVRDDGTVIKTDLLTPAK